MILCQVLAPYEWLSEDPTWSVPGHVLRCTNTFEGFFDLKYANPKMNLACTGRLLHTLGVLHYSMPKAWSGLCV